MNRPLSNMFDQDPTSGYRTAHVADAMRMVRQFFWPAVLLAAIGAGLTACILVGLGPYYTATAFIRFDFEAESLEAKDHRPPLQADPMAVVETAARELRSRPMAVAIVDQLSLEHDPVFAHMPLQWVIIEHLRPFFRASWPDPGWRDIAVEQFLAKLVITTEPRSYLIAISTSTPDAAKSTRIVNAVAREYLRLERVAAASATLSAALRELADTSEVYEPSHPARRQAQSKVNLIERELAKLSSGNLDEGSPFSNRRLLQAAPISVPSGPSVLYNSALAGMTVLILFLTCVVMFPRKAPSKSRYITKSDITHKEELT